MGWYFHFCVVYFAFTLLSSVVTTVLFLCEINGYTTNSNYLGGALLTTAVSSAIIPFLINCDIATNRAHSIFAFRRELSASLEKC